MREPSILLTLTLINYRVIRQVYQLSTERALQRLAPRNLTKKPARESTAALVRCVSTNQKARARGRQLLPSVKRTSVSIRIGLLFSLLHEA